VKVGAFILIAALPEFVSVTDFCPLALPTVTVPHVSEVGDTVTLPLETAVPVPESAAVSAVELLLLVMLNVAEREPAAVGVKTTLAVQVAEAARAVPQVVEEIEKSAGSVPERDGALRVTELPLVFEIVTVCEVLFASTLTLPKDTVLGEMVTLPVPVPDNETSWGLPEPVSVITSVAVRVPVVVGLNKTVTVQVADAARVVPQVFW